MNVIIRKRSLFQRVIRLPRLVGQHYRTFRPYHSRVAAALLSIRFALLVLK